jgi:hypothetical protein
MKNKRALAFAIALLAAACSTSTAPRSDEAIQISESGKVFTLSVPVSQLTMTLPKGNWFRKDKSALGGGTVNPRYFYFEDANEESLILSGWFEPDRLYSGSAAKQWTKDAAALKKTPAPDPVNVSYEKIGGWDTVMYDHMLDQVVSSHMRAHWVQAGTWIELHLSTTTRQASAENRRKLKSLLRAISVAQKRPQAVAGL